MKNEEKLFLLESANYLVKLVSMESVREFDVGYVKLVRSARADLDNSIILLKKELRWE